jgi:hypothetical protein
VFSRADLDAEQKKYAWRLDHLQRHSDQRDRCRSIARNCALSTYSRAGYNSTGQTLSTSNISISKRFAAQSPVADSAAPNGLSLSKG